ncbi:HMG-box [Metschnikowia bicuspidata var. bicuspidata NRRL YB-4993]|uniref:HMG-box n=1 Tax=Metschnikowia bicuspidata var. bicuspidata NRRL YB-4993 TaxID=869754 RepID=A0A1A0HHK8_9ASCO|nr:HMG-box [Metschnikowia bicuspidata var. bicuspidata NRRL YB-4993]OBA23490.1 HMG-box [Metschnikowia bicuspidata var. bicuspidata NRRL YB-4993]
MEESNEVATVALLRTRNSIRRLRLEYAVLLERLETQVVRILEDGNPKLSEAMARPFSPVLTDDNLEAKLAKVKVARPKKAPGVSRAALKRAARDPNLPKRPTNAYLMFCDREKDRVRSELERQNPGQPATELTRALTDAWKLLSDEQKIPYLELYEIDRERYQREMMVYNEQKHDETLVKGKLVAQASPGLGPVEPQGSTEPGTPTQNAEEVENNDENGAEDEGLEDEPEAQDELDDDATLGLKREFGSSVESGSLPEQGAEGGAEKRQKV